MTKKEMIDFIEDIWDAAGPQYLDRIPQHEDLIKMDMAQLKILYKEAKEMENQDPQIYHRHG